MNPRDRAEELNGPAGAMCAPSISVGCAICSSRKTIEGIEEIGERLRIGRALNERFEHRAPRDPADVVATQSGSGPRRSQQGRHGPNPPTFPPTSGQTAVSRRASPVIHRQQICRDITGQTRGPGATAKYPKISMVRKGSPVRVRKGALYEPAAGGRQRGRRQSERRGRSMRCASVT